MSPFKLLISRKEALNILLGSVRPIERTEVIPVEEALNRVLAEDVIPDVDVPPFDRASMDGYAVRAEDTYGASSMEPRILRLTGAIHAGESTDKEVGIRECIRIATGSPIPRGADAVVMVEYAEEDGDKVHIYRAVHPGANIARRGEDIKGGKPILRSGSVINPARIGVLAALGMREVKVYEKPRFAVLPTGTEICELGSKP
ncbi:MAG: molybdopterin molybdotransferase MoeA, partial [Candidatus Bathyarchaeia archaeon]